MTTPAAAAATAQLLGASRGHEHLGCERQSKLSWHNYFLSTPKLLRATLGCSWLLLHSKQTSMSYNVAASALAL
eukprot:438-Heterococcus_DN1.PRE.1